MQVKEIQCKSAIGKCGFPGGGFAINPYVGCGHNCAYCYARFMKRFTGHANEQWGNFIDARINIAEILEKQIKSPKYKGGRIYIGTVTDPYQPVEKKYKLTRSILEILCNYNNPISILTKSNLITRDLDLLKKFKNIDVNFTINTLDEKWVRLIEPESPGPKERLQAAKKLSDQGIKVITMMGPFWPNFTVPEKLITEYAQTGITRIFSESFNTTGGNWTGVETILKKYYPELLLQMKKILFNEEEFDEFHAQAKHEIKKWASKYKIPTTIFFAQGHAAKFKKP